jgi:cell division septal protein FtsQ
VRKALSYLPLVGKALLSVVAGVLIFTGYRAAASASFFQARNLDVSGTSRASADEIKALLRREVSQTGVWRADLAALGAEIERQPWVRNATVSRVLPDGIRVRVAERVQRAVVRTAGGKFIWVDDDAVSLGPMSPADRMPAFFIRGWDESGEAAARAENRERVQKYLEMTREWEALGLSARVSEVNLGDLRDVRVQLAGDDSQIEVRLGEKDFGSRLRRALRVLDEQRNTPRGPFITYIMTLETRTIIGTSTGSQVSGEGAGEVPAGAAVRAGGRDGAAPKPDGRKREEAKEKRGAQKKKEGVSGGDRKKTEKDAKASRQARRT